MKNELTVFSSPEFGEIRTIELNGEPWFVGKDVALALGYSNPQKAIRDHVDMEDVTVNESFTVNGTAITLINESGLYSLILSSKLPTAKKFKRWVTLEVLPAIRKTGCYGEAPHRVLTKDDYMKAASLVSGCRNERLPYVLGFLKQAGFSIPEVEAQESPEDDGVDLVALLKPYSLDELTNKLGIPRTSMYYYKIGRCRPHGQRLAYIIETLS